jgi:DNA replication protein DnaC
VSIFDEATKASGYGTLDMATGEIVPKLVLDEQVSGLRKAERGETVTRAGATGLGKTWLACALAQYACRQGRSALYLRVPRLAEDLRILHGAGSFRRWLQQLAKIDVLVLDDWGIGNLDAATRADLLEVIDDRVGQRATIIAHQLPIEHWHAWLGDPTVADAILDRLLQSCRRFSLDGESRRTGRTARTATVSKTTIKDPHEDLTASPKP